MPMISQDKKKQHAYTEKMAEKRKNKIRQVKRDKKAVQDFIEENYPGAETVFICNRGAKP